MARKTSKTAPIGNRPAVTPQGSKLSPPAPSKGNTPKPAACGPACACKASTDPLERANRAIEQLEIAAQIISNMARRMEKERQQLDAILHANQSHPNDPLGRAHNNLLRKMGEATERQTVNVPGFPPELLAMLEGMGMAVIAVDGR